MTQRSPPTAAVQYMLRIADSSLIHGQRLSQWCGHAPVLEEDIALTNIALDHIGQQHTVDTRFCCDSRKFIQTKSHDRIKITELPLCVGAISS